MLQTSCAYGETHYSEAALLYRLAMIATLCPYIEPPLCCKWVVCVLSSQRLFLASSCLRGWTLVALQTLSASICNQHWRCINLCALACVFVCAQAFRNDGNILRPPTPPPPPHPPPSPTHNCNSTYHSRKTKSTKSTRFFYQPVSSKKG